MNRRGRTAAMAAGVVALMGVVSSTSLRAQQPGFKRVEVQRHDLGTPGREVVQVRAEFEPGASIGKHTHPGEEIGYILEGSLRFEMAGQAPVTLKAGDHFMVPMGKVHSATAVGTANAKVLATYIVEKGKPIATPAP